MPKQDPDSSDLVAPAPPTMKHKTELVRALLEIGALPQSLFLLAEFPFLLNSEESIADAFNNVIEHVLEPLWAGLRPQRFYPEDAAKSLRQPRKVPEEPKYRDSALVLPPSRKIEINLHLRPQIRNEAAEQKFFYDDIPSQLQICNTYDEFETRVLPYIRLAGVQISRSTQLCAKIARIGKQALSSLPEGRTLWQSILRANLLPALSLTEANPAYANDVFALIKEFTTEERYALYGEWFSESYRKVQELKVQFVKTEKETKNLLRRISKTNTKEYGRRLAKVSHSNPCIVLNIALNQIESYDNLVDVVIEASRYFTLLTFDVLVYIMLTLLSNTQKRRLKDDGTSVAHWLQSLSSFTAKIFKRYSHMDAGPICTYVAKQLTMNNAFDLIILRDLISEMAGLRPGGDLSEDQLQGCTGGPFLKVEALTLINDRRDSSARAPLRLLHALQRTNLIYKLPVWMGQQRTHCVYNVPEEQSLLKLLANLADEVSQILQQYMEFLTINADPVSYSAAVPSVSSLVKDNSLEPVIAFVLVRPVLHAMFLGLSITNSKSKSSDGNQDVEMVDVKDIEMIDAEDDASDPDAEQSKSRAPINAGSEFLSIVQRTAADVQTILPKETWSYMDPEFYAAFWSLSSSDLSVPKARYDKEIALVRQQILDLESDKGLVTSTEVRTRAIERTKLESILNGLSAELILQEANHKVTSEFMTSRSRVWFDRTRMLQSAVDPTEWRRRSAANLVQHCLLPRCLFSPNDARYTAQLLLSLHDLAAPHLNIMRVYGQLFGAQLATSIFTCTEREAEDLGRFLGDILKRLNDLSESESAYHSARVRLKFPESQEFSSTTEFMPWEQFKELWYRSLHRAMWTNVRACFESKEYMNIRNVLIVLDRMQGSMPYFKWIGRNVEKEVDVLISSERREDLKIRALGYKAVLKKQQARWHEAPKSQGAVESKQRGKVVEAENLETSEKRSPVSGRSSKQEDQPGLNPDVPAFEPQITSASTDMPAPLASSLSPTSMQREVAKRKAAILSQELRAKQNTSRLSQDNKLDIIPKPSTQDSSDGFNDKISADNFQNEDKLNDRNRNRNTSSRLGSRAASPRTSTQDRTSERGESRQASKYPASAREAESLRRRTPDDTRQVRDPDRNREPPANRDRDSIEDNVRSRRQSPTQTRSAQSSNGRSVGRLNDYDNDNGSSRHTRNAQYDNYDSCVDQRESNDRRPASRYESRDDAEISVRSRGRLAAVPSTNDRYTEPSRSVPEGPRSLGSRVSSNNGPQNASNPRNASDNPRRPRSPVEAPTDSTSFRNPPRNNLRQVQATPRSQNTNSRTPQRSPAPVVSAPLEPVVHPSRQQILKVPTGEDRLSDPGRMNRSIDRDHAPPRNQNPANEVQRQPARSRDEPLPRTSARDTRDVRPRDADSRESRESRNSSARMSTRIEPRSTEAIDLRDGRLDRADGRRDRGGDRRDEQESKRRHASDSRDNGRPAKQRRR